MTKSSADQPDSKAPEKKPEEQPIVATKYPGLAPDGAVVPPPDDEDDLADSPETDSEEKAEEVKDETPAKGKSAPKKSRRWTKKTKAGKKPLPPLKSSERSATDTPEDSDPSEDDSSSSAAKSKTEDSEKSQGTARTIPARKRPGSSARSSHTKQTGRLQAEKAAAKDSSSDKEPTEDEGEKPDEVTDDTVVPFSGEDATERAARQRKRTIRQITIAASVVALGFIVWVVLYFTPVLAVEEIEISGHELITTDEAEAGLEPLYGRPIPQINDKKVLAELADIPAVKDVNTRAEMPHTLVVEIVEYPPVAMSPRKGKYVVWNNAGEELAVISKKAAQEYELPVVASSSDVSDPDLFNAITEVLGFLPDELRDQVTKASGASIDSIELSLSNGKKIVWGNTTQPKQKIAVLEALLNLDEKQTAQIKEYDVTTPDHPVTR